MSNFEILTINNSAELVASNIDVVGCNSLVSMSDAVHCTTALNETNGMQTDANSVSSMVNFSSQEQFVGESIPQVTIQRGNLSDNSLAQVWALFPSNRNQQ